MQTLFSANQPDSRERAEGWLGPVPIPYIDRYLLAIRWVALLGVAVIIAGTEAAWGLEPAYGQIRLDPLAVLPFVFGGNLLLSAWVWRARPLATGRVGWLLPVDLAQAVLLTGLTGGIGSVFFVLYLIVLIEVALVFYWQTGLLLTIGIVLLHLATVYLNLPLGWDSAVVANAAAKSFVILMLGVLVTLFSQEIRREAAARSETALAAARAALLNEIFLRLGEPGLEPRQILNTVLDGARVLPAADFGLALLPEPETGGNVWQVAASTTPLYPVGQRITGLNWAGNGPQIFEVGAGAGHPLPGFVTPGAAAQLICARLTLPGGDTPGLIVIGRQTARPLSDAGRSFLRLLVAEAGLALRNANLYAREQEQVARLRRFEELQSVFFSAIGHELKTPLTVLKTLTPSLRRLPELSPATQAEIIDTIEQNLARLELLITDLLESSRLEANAVALRCRPTSLPNRVRRVLKALSPVLERRKQSVQVKAGPGLPRVWADGRRVEQILSNLVNNAAKFAPPGSTIEVCLTPLPQAVQVCVVDPGPGVPPGERERIFDKFYIAAQDKALAGVGLGLFICRELVRLHRGRIWLEDRPGGGSRFCFTLPVAKENPTNEAGRL